MIKLFDGWAINADENCYTLGKPKQTVNKDGKTVITMTNTTYHPSIKNSG